MPGHKNYDKRIARLILLGLIVALLVVAVIIAFVFGAFSGAQKSGSSSSAVSTSAESSLMSSSDIISSSESVHESVSVSSSESVSSKPSLSSKPSVPPEPPTPPEPMSDEDLFTDAAFIGNSCSERLFLQGFAPQAEFLTRTGLNVSTVFTTPSTRGSIPIVDELAGERKFKRIFILFGSNELGWSSTDIFVEQYGKLIDAVKERQPGALIYIQAIPPVTHAADERNTFNVNNARINEYNALLLQLAADKGVNFLDIASVMRGEDGALPDEASTDGVHLSKEYGEKWIEYIRNNVTE